MGKTESLKPLDAETVSLEFAELMGCAVDGVNLTDRKHAQRITENYVALLPFAMPNARSEDNRHVVASAIVHTCRRQPSAFAILQKQWSQEMAGESAVEPYQNYLGGYGCHNQNLAGLCGWGYWQHSC